MRPKLKNIITSILPRPSGGKSKQGLRNAHVLCVVECGIQMTGPNKPMRAITIPWRTSRTVIRAASLRLLPDVHARSIDQLF